jgi:CheY-like chemotaxis protein
MKLHEGVFKGTRILCVDDCLGELEILRAILTNEGADVSVCNSAEDAIQLLRSKRFQLIVSDLSMPPGLDGYDMVHALRRMEEENPVRAATPAIAVSGDACKPSNKRRYSDFQFYMPKPVDIDRFVYIVDRLLLANNKGDKRGPFKASSKAVMG